MAEIHNIDDHRPHILVQDGDSAYIISHKQLRDIASGEVSIAEYEDPEKAARAMAIILVNKIDDN